MAVRRMVSLVEMVRRARHQRSRKVMDRTQILLTEQVIVRMERTQIMEMPQTQMVRMEKHRRNQKGMLRMVRHQRNQTEFRMAMHQMVTDSPQKLRRFHFLTFRRAISFLSL